MKRGFTLIEMLVVIGIIAVLAGATIASFNKLTKGAEKAKAQEQVHQVATALAKIWETDGNWPKRLRENGGERGGILDKDNALVLAKHGALSLTTKGKDKDMKLAGRDRFGLLTPWATKAVDRNASATEGTKVDGGATIADHRLHFAVDVDGDGVISGVDVGGETIDIRATAVVWCIGKSGGQGGQPWPYSIGQKKDDVYSWSVGQTKAVQ